MKDISLSWTGMIDTLQTYTSRLHCIVVRWNNSEEGWVTCNTDGASKGNPGMSSYGFCVRNREGDLIYAEAQNLGITTNMEAESLAILQALRYYIHQEVHNVKLETESVSQK